MRTGDETHGVIGIEDRWREPRAGIVETLLLMADDEVLSVSLISFLNCSLFIFNSRRLAIAIVLDDNMICKSLWLPQYLRPPAGAPRRANIDRGPENNTVERPLEMGEFDAVFGCFPTVRLREMVSLTPLWDTSSLTPFWIPLAKIRSFNIISSL